MRTKRTSSVVGVARCMTAVVKITEYRRSQENKVLTFATFTTVCDKNFKEQRVTPWKCKM